MQSSSAYQPLAATAGNPGVVPPSMVSTGGTLGGFAVLVASTVNAFFSSLSSACSLDHRRQTSKFAATDLPKSSGSPAKSDDGVGINDGEIHNFSSVRDRACNRDNSSGQVAGVNRGTIQGISLRDTLVNHQTVNPLATISRLLCVNANPRLVDSRCVGRQPAESSWQCASAPVGSLCGSIWLPIEVNDEETINGIGCSARYPSDACYMQTSDLDGSKLNDNSSLVFDGHCDGRSHTIRNQHTCLFDNLRGTLKTSLALLLRPRLLLLSVPALLLAAVTTSTQISRKRNLVMTEVSDPPVYFHPGKPICANSRSGGNRAVALLNRRPPHTPGSVVSKPDPRGSSAGFSAAVPPTIAAFLSPGCVPERMQRSSTLAPEAGTSEKRLLLDALNRLKLTCNMASCWLPSVKAVSDAVATVCSSLSGGSYRTFASTLEKRW